jgi:hypothetical protein
MRIFKFYLFFFILVIFNHRAFAWNDFTTHPHITLESTRNSSLNNFLSKQLGLSQGVVTKINGKPLSEWLRHGSKEEDSPACRASNHFHDPYQPWQYGGLTDTHWLVDLWCWGLGLGQYPSDEIRSNLTWATGCLTENCYGPGGVDTDGAAFNKYNWSSARQYFYTYLTGRNDKGIEVAPDQAGRNAYLVETLKSLGQVLHLLQDTAVPAHVRNDFSKGHTMISPGSGAPWTWIGNRFEKFVERNAGREWFSLVPIGPKLDNLRLTRLWDTDQLTSTTVPADQSTLGLAEYTSMNFLSEYSMFDVFFPYPSLEHCVVVASSPPIDVNTPLERQYLASINGHPGEAVNHLAVVSYLKHFQEVYLPSVSSVRVPLYMDDNCYNEYASKLIPRAVGYSAALLDYFFRGTIEIKHPHVKFVSDDSGIHIGGFTFHARNSSMVGDTDEPLIEGSLELVYRYVPKDQTEPVYGVVNNAHIRQKDSTESYLVDETATTPEPLNDGYVALTVDLPAAPYIPLDAHEVGFWLIFSGTLGSEKDIAVAVGSHRFGMHDHDNITRLAYHFNRNENGEKFRNPANIYTVLAGGDDQRNLTRLVEAPVPENGPFKSYYSPAWSPDGRLLTFTRETCEYVHPHTYSFPRRCWNPATPNAQKLFSDIIVVDQSAGPVDPVNPLKVISNQALQPPLARSYAALAGPTFSPDKRYILSLVQIYHHLNIAADPNRVQEGFALYDLQNDKSAYINGWHAGQAYDFETFFYPNELWGSAAVWSPDGQHIAYGMDKNTSTFGDTFYDYDICTIDPYLRYETDPVTHEPIFYADGSNNRTINTDDHAYAQPSWSPDGQCLVFVSDRSGSGKTGIWIMDRQGGNPQHIYSSDFNCWNPTFSPDGMRVAFIQEGSICTVGLNGEDFQVVTSISGPNELMNEVVWSPYLDDYAPTVTLEARQGGQAVSHIRSGESVTLVWASSGADKIKIEPGLGEQALMSGEVTVAPPADTVFTISAYNWAAKSEAKVSIAVVP